jgi:hypothetical protein
VYVQPPPFTPAVERRVTWFNGKKRYLLLGLFIAQALIQLTYPHVDIVDATRILLFGLPSELLAFGLVTCQILLGLYAMYDGWRKDREIRSRLNR